MVETDYISLAATIQQHYHSYDGRCTVGLSLSYICPPHLFLPVLSCVEVSTRAVLLASICF